METTIVCWGLGFRVWIGGGGSVRHGAVLYPWLGYFFAAGYVRYWVEMPMTVRALADQRDIKGVQRHNKSNYYGCPAQEFCQGYVETCP